MDWIYSINEKVVDKQRALPRRQIVLKKSFTSLLIPVYYSQRCLKVLCSGTIEATKSQWRGRGEERVNGEGGEGASRQRGGRNVKLKVTLLYCLNKWGPVEVNVWTEAPNGWIEGMNRWAVDVWVGWMGRIGGKEEGARGNGIDGTHEWMKSRTDILVERWMSRWIG